MAKSKKLETLNHVLLPKHSKLKKKELEALYKKYSITTKEMPKILNTDPAILALEPEIGDIIKIERNSPTAGTSYYYRVVTEGVSPKIVLIQENLQEKE